MIHQVEVDTSLYAARSAPIPAKHAELAAISTDWR
jgi:hypothetical protein